eukprot:Skav226680  [mRNA]  locus=scaffold3971:22577:23323:- [translate_table: standard]
MYRIHSAQWPALAPRILTQSPSKNLENAFGAVGSGIPMICDGSFAARASGTHPHVPSVQRAIRSFRGTERRSVLCSCFQVAAAAATVSICRRVAAHRARRSSTLARKAAAQVQTEENLGAMVSPLVATDPDAPVTGVYDTIRSVESLAVPFTNVKTLGAENGPAIGEEVWIRARVATVRVKGKSTFVVLRENSLYTVQACKFKDKEDGGESATAVARFFKSIPLDLALFCFFRVLFLRGITKLHTILL